MNKKRLNLFNNIWNYFLITLGFFIIAKATDSNKLFIIVILLIINDVSPFNL